MSKSTIGVFFSVVLLVAAPFQAGVCLAQATSGGYTIQEIINYSDPMYTGYLQAIGNWHIQNFGEGGAVTLDLSNATVGGVSSFNAGLGSVRNQGTVVFLNIKPDEEVLPARHLGLMTSDNNRVMVSGYNYHAGVNFDKFNGSGIMAINVMAASFSNSFTSVTVNMGKMPVTPVSLPPNLTVIPENPGLFTSNYNVVPGASVVALSNEQMDMIAGSSNNLFIYWGKQKATATIEGTSNFTGICAVTVSAGVNNQISHTVQANFNTGQQ